MHHFKSVAPLCSVVGSINLITLEVKEIYKLKIYVHYSTPWVEQSNKAKKMVISDS